MAKKWYVYTLTDPDSRRIFYVGKGCGARMYHHGRDSDKANHAKVEEIARIGRDNVLRRKVAVFSEESDAFRYEAKLVSHIDGLTNAAKTGVRKRKEETFFGGIFKFLDMISLMKRKRKTEKEVAEEAKRIIEKWAPVFEIGAAYSEGHKQIFDIPKKFLESKGYRIKYGISDA